MQQIGECLDLQGDNPQTVGLGKRLLEQAQSLLLFPHLQQDLCLVDLRVQGVHHSVGLRCSRSGLVAGLKRLLMPIHL